MTHRAGSKPERGLDRMLSLHRLSRGGVLLGSPRNKSAELVTMLPGFLPGGPTLAVTTTAWNGEALHTGALR